MKYKNLLLQKLPNTHRHRYMHIHIQKQFKWNYLIIESEGQCISQTI